MNAAVIPARGGSKRIPGKNIRPFANRPMICHSIAAARASGLFDAIVVSTDSEEIARVARDCGAETPFLRPASLADDQTPIAPVLLHALAELEARGRGVDNLCLIYATAPFLTPEALREGLRVLEERRADAVFSVTSFPAPVQRALTLDARGRLRMLWPEHEVTRSQDLPQAFHDAGQFHWVRASALRATGRLYMENAYPVIIPRHLSQDIDTPEDWDRAEMLFRFACADRGETGKNEGSAT